MLLREGPPSLSAKLRREIIDDQEAPSPAEILTYDEVRALCRKQRKDGGFPAGPAERALGGTARFADALATLRTLDRLADLGIKGEKVVEAVAERLLASQDEGGGLADLALAGEKGKRSTIVAVHFHGWALAALCRAGYDADPRVDLGFRFLVDLRQHDGGWSWRGVRADSPTRPSSHLATGMVLRAFAASPTRRTWREARRAAELLATRILQPDRYPDRREASHWESLQEPRFYPDVLDALESMTALGLGKENAGVRTAEAYMRGRQGEDGLWHPGPPKAAPSAKERETARWLTVRVLAVLRRLN